MLYAVCFMLVRVASFTSINKLFNVLVILVVCAFAYTCSALDATVLGYGANEVLIMLTILPFVIFVLLLDK